MSILSDLTGIKNILSGLQSNKVTRIAYDENAYTNNTVASPENYDWEQHNNIPQQTLSAMKMTDQQIEKGFRLRFPILNKYFFNAFFGRVSYNLNKLTDFFYSAVDALMSSLGEPNGLATLDSNGRLPASQVSETLLTFKGTWLASTNTPTLSDGMAGATKGDMYVASDGGTVTFGTGNTVIFLPDDRVVYDGKKWNKWVAGSVRRVCDILPDGTGNIDLLLQTDVTKILNPNVLGTLFYWGIGRNWVQGSGTTGFTNFLSVRHANNMWVAGAHSNGGVWWSEDGNNWTQSDTATISTSHIRSVYFGNNVWVACTDSNGIWWSEDGKNWTQSSTTATQSLSFREALYKTNMWVAIANGSVWYSTDGKTWTQASGITSSDYYAVVKSNSLWVVGSGATAYWSTDGINWTACTGGITGACKFYYKNNMFVACTSAGLWWSTDGKAWTQTSTTAIQSYAFYSVYYANGVWVAGTNAHGVWYSTDGKTWTQGSGIGTTETVPFVFYANSIYLAGSTTTGLWISSDGQSWSLVSSEVKFIAGVPFDYGIFQEGMFLLASTAGLYYSDWTTI